MGDVYILRTLQYMKTKLDYYYYYYVRSYKQF